MAKCGTTKLYHILPWYLRFCTKISPHHIMQYQIVSVPNDAPYGKPTHHATQHLGVAEQGPRKTKACLSPSFLMSSHTTTPWTIWTTGVIVFETEAARNNAAPLPGPVVWGRQVTVVGHKSGQDEDKGSQLSLWKLPPSTVEGDLREYYANAGLKHINFKMTPDYASSVGMAFVRFESPKAAMAALRMGPPEIRGSKCQVRFSKCPVRFSEYQGDKEVCPCALVRIRWRPPPPHLCASACIQVPSSRS